MIYILRIILIFILSLSTPSELRAEIREVMLKCETTSKHNNVYHGTRFYYIIPQHNLSMEERNSQLRNKKKGNIVELTFAVHEEFDNYVLTIPTSYDIEESNDGRYYKGNTAPLPIEITVDRESLTIIVNYNKNDEDSEEELFNCNVPSLKEKSISNWQLYFYFIQTTYPDYLKDLYLNKKEEQYKKNKI
jgi:hypothetical protein